ncbi:MAG TPA: tryptophan-rich sensory protein [Candidatus Omnitrophota bacterium]|jgi:tryptophan-rich sensory protein|nr:MAG: TspO/MBR family protein [Candidatus Omnitrophica bacterium ADurb.Bin314]HPW65104.1 tryptophan-rich sensory protein [Candidatus Omnitrophota bacterium]HQB93620.1 tryptophan-rich sensory protein [Candidatus Omnitrophota bacterium]
MRFVKLVLSLVFCFAAGAAGAAVISQAIPSWYATLEKPSFAPPARIFGPVWSALYLMMGIAAWIVWSKGLKEEAVRKGLALFLFQLALNSVWSYLFFGLRSPFCGLLDILFLWAAILATIGQFSKVSITAAVLLIPYLAWVTFAAGLNFGICLLNR